MDSLHNSRLSIVILGYGVIRPLSARAIRSYDNAELAAIIDPSPQTTEKKKQKRLACHTLRL
jgi:hypothetical protein